MSEIGYVRIHRTLLGHPAFRNDAEAMAFAWMVVRAAWRPTRVRYKEHPISLARGQLAISVRDMATALDRDKAWVERLWKRLKSETMIKTATETGVTVVTICKYIDYQSPKEKGETLSKTPNETGARQGQDTEQEGEESKKEEEDNPPTPLLTEGVEIPEWVPRPQWLAFIDMRKRQRKMPTAHAVELLIRKLDKLRSDNHPPGDVLDQSTLKSWLDIFPIKESRNGNQNFQRSNGQGDDKRSGLARALDRELAGG